MKSDRMPKLVKKEEVTGHLSAYLCTCELLNKKKVLKWILLKRMYITNFPARFLHMGFRVVTLSSLQHPTFTSSDQVFRPKANSSIKIRYGVGGGDGNWDLKGKEGQPKQSRMILRVVVYHHVGIQNRNRIIIPPPYLLLINEDSIPPLQSQSFYRASMGRRRRSVTEILKEKGCRRKLSRMILRVVVHHHVGSQSRNLIIIALPYLYFFRWMIILPLQS